MASTSQSTLSNITRMFSLPAISPSLIATLIVVVPVQSVASVVLACNNSDYMGFSCNISTSLCDLLVPCLNQGTCTANKTIPQGYICHCSLGYEGIDCELDTRPCKPNTCWNHGRLTQIPTGVIYDDVFLLRYLPQSIHGRCPVRVCSRMDK